jgi:hypothetical protein
MTGVVVVTVVLFSLLIGGADYALGYAVKPIYLQNANNSTASSPAQPATTAIPTATASASASASASATPSVSPSASASS